MARRMKPRAMKAMGIVEMMIEKGAPAAAAATTNPITAARLYAGAMLEDASTERSANDKERSNRRVPVCPTL